MQKNLFKHTQKKQSISTHARLSPATNGGRQKSTPNKKRRTRHTCALSARNSRQMRQTLLPTLSTAHEIVLKKEPFLSIIQHLHAAKLQCRVSRSCCSSSRDKACLCDAGFWRTAAPPC